MNLTKEDLKRFASISFERAKEFEQDRLKTKRDEFFADFLMDNNLTRDS